MPPLFNFKDVSGSPRKMKKRRVTVHILKAFKTYI